MSRLLYVIIPISIIAYILMYHLGLSDSAQWRVYFIHRELQMFILALVVFFQMKGTSPLRPVGFFVVMWMGYNMLVEIINLNTKGNVIEIIWLCLAVMLVALSIKPLRKWIGRIF